MRRTAQAGFTLIELVLVMGILVVVLAGTYRIILDCLDAERTIDKLTRPEKEGEGILGLARRDLSAVLWRNMGTRVFSLEDGGEGLDARDVLKFVSTVEPTPLEELSSGQVAVTQLRTITALWYFLRPNEGIDGIPMYTLYRKEITDFPEISPLEGAGQSYEVHDKVAYLSFKCFDGVISEWFNEWDSELRIQEEQIFLEEAAAGQEGIARVSQVRVSDRGAAGAAGGASALSAPGVNPDTGAGGGSRLEPPAAVPSAVRIEVGIYVAQQGGRLERQPDGTPIVKTYATIVPIVTANRLRLDLEELSGAEGELGEEGGEEGDEGGLTGGHNAPGRGGGAASGPRRGGKTSSRAAAKGGTGPGISPRGLPGGLARPPVGSSPGR